MGCEVIGTIENVSDHEQESELVVLFEQSENEFNELEQALEDSVEQFLLEQSVELEQLVEHGSMMVA
jgi:hypothetical protein